MKIITTLCFLAIGYCHNAQENLSGTVPQKAAQPLSNNIMVIFQDSRHVYWFGSWEDGLYRYDGKTVIHYTTADGLRNNRIDQILEDQEGNIFLNTPEGVSRFNGVRFTDINVDTQTLGVWQLSPGDLWFKGINESAHVYRFDGERLHGLNLPTLQLAEDFLAANRPAYPRMPSPYIVYTTYTDSKGHVWFGTAAAGAYRFDGKMIDMIATPDVIELHHGPSNGVRSIAEDIDGKFWFNSSYRYTVYDDDKGMHYQRESSIGSLDGIPDGGINEYLSAVRDEHGAIWMVTYRDGVWKYDPSKSKVNQPHITHYPILDGNEVVKLFYIYKDNRGDLWLGTHDHGVYKFNGKAFERFIP